MVEKAPENGYLAVIFSVLVRPNRTIVVSICASAQPRGDANGI
jgi:hypothetical protein